MKKLNELNSFEILTLTNLITNSIFECLDECELPVVKQICSNIISQICLLESQRISKECLEKCKPKDDF